MSRSKMLIVDDQKLFRENMKIVIELRLPDVQVVAMASDGREALEAFHRFTPDIIVLDMRMPVMDGVEFLQNLKGVSPRPKVLVLTTFDDDDYLLEAMNLGASGYLLKEIDPEDLTKAIEQVLHGEMPVSPKLTAKLIRRSALRNRDEPYPTSVDLKALTPRELEVLKRIALGEDNHEIAKSLFLAEGTVKNHVSNIYDKLGFKDRAQAVRFAIVSGLT